MRSITPKLTRKVALAGKGQFSSSPILHPLEKGRYRRLLPKLPVCSLYVQVPSVEKHSQLPRTPFLDRGHQINFRVKPTICPEPREPFRDRPQSV